MHAVRYGLLVGAFRVDREVLIGALELACGIDAIDHMMHCLWHVVFPFQIYPDRPRGDLIDQAFDLWRMQCRAEEQRLHAVLAALLDLGAQPRDVLPIVLLPEVVGLVQNQEPDTGHVELLAPHVIHRLLQGADAYVDALLQGLQLLPLVHAADEQHTTKRRIVKVLVKPRHALVSLLRKFPRRLQDHAHRGPLASGLRRRRHVSWVDVTNR
mmetsp:Transcript_101832/g.287270  ORF Transcript_101832/g.287270 Transcript_101832/m.287270 type:complete len:212 (+) Transcript_101832:1225-1860(+)